MPSFGEIQPLSAAKQQALTLFSLTSPPQRNWDHLAWCALLPLCQLTCNRDVLWCSQRVISNWCLRWGFFLFCFVLFFLRDEDMWHQSQQVCDYVDHSSLHYWSAGRLSAPRDSLFVTWPLKGRRLGTEETANWLLPPHFCSRLFSWQLILQQLSVYKNTRKWHETNKALYLHKSPYTSCLLGKKRTSACIMSRQSCNRVVSCCIIMFHLDNSAACCIPSIYHELIIGLVTEGGVRITALILLLYLFLPPYVILLSLCYHAVFVFHPLGVPHLVSETLLMYQKTLADHTLCTSRRRWFHAAVPRQ